jgi:hypothetical protein
MMGLMAHKGLALKDGGSRGSGKDDDKDKDDDDDDDNEDDEEEEGIDIPWKPLLVLICILNM